MSLDHTGGPEATPRGIGLPEAQPLLSALEGGTARTRLAVLDALTRLPLEPDCSLEVRGYVLPLLDDPQQRENASRLLAQLDRADVGSAPARLTAPPLPDVTATDRARVRDAIGRARLGEAEGTVTEWQAGVEHVVDALAAGDDRRLLRSLVVSELFRLAALRQDVRFGNAVAELVHELGDEYAPDLAGLLEAYRPLASVERTGVGAQIAWTAAGVGLNRLLPGLASALASPGDRLAAARLVAQATEYVDAGGPPIFGVVPTAPTAPAPTRGLPPATEPRSEPDPARARPEPRWINAAITDAGRPEHRLERAFRAGAVHEIAVFIGPELEGALAAKGDESFDEALGPVGDMEQLLVMLIPPPAISPPQTGTIFLPQTGTSRPCTFAVQVPVGLDTFEAQIQLYHRNRMIQMALLRGGVVADPEHAGPDTRIELELAVIRPGTADLGNREQFDLAVARTGAHTTGVADEELVLFDNDRIEGVVPTLTQILESIATGDPARRADLADPDVVENLRALAFQGRELDEAIGEPLRDQLGDRTLDRVQVLVESASDFLPIELVYGFPTPRTDAGLCPGWKDALLKGRCESDHEARGPRHLADTVCPLGFWALSKVIERQVVGAESWARQGLRGVEFAIRSHPSAERMSLRPPNVALFAASNRVDQVKEGQIEGVLKTLERIADTATYAETWDGWVEAVGRNSPTLLVLLSHTKELQRNAALEIGEDQACLLAQLNGDYIKGSSGDRPVVLLLGCETAVTDFGLQTFVSKFQDLGAALVVGTIASVLGQRAAPVARTIATELASASKRRRPIAAAELLLAIRRKLLARGELTALCLTAFGDADWQVGGG